MGLGSMFGKRRRDALDATSVDDASADDAEESADAESDTVDGGGPDDIDWDELDAREWRENGPYDVAEVDPAELDEPDPLRIDLGSLVITGFEGMELRLQIAEDSQQIVSALMIKDDSALEVAVFAAPRSGGLWSELREEITEATNEAGGSIAHVEGPYGTELRRLLPMVTPDGEQGYQPSRMWVPRGRAGACAVSCTGKPPWWRASTDRSSRCWRRSARSSSGVAGMRWLRATCCRCSCPKESSRPADLTRRRAARTSGCTWSASRPDRTRGRAPARCGRTRPRGWRAVRSR